MPTELGSQPDALAVPCPFHSGDQAYLAKGSYTGSGGKCLNLTSDPQCADIREPNRGVRAHPVEWMTLTSPPNVAMHAAGIKA